MLKGQKATLATRKKISEAIKKHWRDNYKLNMQGVAKTAEKLRGRKRGPHTEETKQKISESERGKTVSMKTRFKQRRSRLNFSKNNPEIEKMRGLKTGNALRGRKQKKDVVDAVKQKWKDPIYKARRLKQMLQFKVPTRPEQKVIDICKRFELPFTFVGNGKLIIDGFNPDFVNTNGEKSLIEVFGDYWHNRADWKERDERRFRVYSKYGYKTLVLWEHELVSRKGIPAKYTDEEIRDKLIQEGT